jgi:glycosyltransferase involved in cell wall biosynthesis
LTYKSDDARAQLIDVTIATLNSAPTIEKCVQSILANIPVRSLLVVDGASSDRTLDILKRYRVKVIEERALLGWTRYLQARNCETEWIAYFDSDVYAYDSWWKNVSSYAEQPDVGMILGFADAPVNELPIYDAYLKHRAKNEGTVAFSNTLIRRRLVLECRDELRGAHAGEDDIVAAHVRASGFKIITIPKSLCYHDRDPFKTHPQVYFRSGQSARMKYGLRGITVVPSALLNITSAWCRFSTETGNYNPRLLFFLVRLWFAYAFGFLKRNRQIS